MSKQRLKWQRVTNEFVSKFFGQKGCKNCDGNGYIGDSVTGMTICSCAALAFRREMIGTGKIRMRKQRIGTKDVKWMEYRDLGLAEQLESTNDD